MKGPIKTVVFEIVLIGCGVFTGAWVVLWSMRGSFLTAVIMLGVTTWAIGFAVYYLYTTTLGLAKPRTESGPTGTLLLPSRLVNGMFFVPNTGSLVAAALFIVFAPFGMVDFMPSGAMRLWVPFSCAFLLCFGVPTLIRSVKHGGSVRLQLHPRGIDVWDGQWGTLRHAHWGQVEEILDRRPKGKKSFNEVVGLVFAKGASAVVKADDITGDSATLREWVRFYWTHPESRDELVDGRGLQRLADGHFTTE